MILAREARHKILRYSKNQKKSTVLYAQRDQGFADGPRNLSMLPDLDICYETCTATLGACTALHSDAQRY